VSEQQQPPGGWQRTGEGTPAGQSANGWAPTVWDAAYEVAESLDQVNGMSAADALVWYNRHGIPAYPAHPTEKMLALRAGYHFDDLGVLTGDQLGSTYQIMCQNPQLRVALIMGQASGLLAIDVDDLAEWGRFRAEHEGQLPVTAEQGTGRDGGGLHQVFRRGDADEALLKQGRWSAAYPHIEVKSKGMIIAAPSLHASGACYQWHPGPWPVEIGEVLERRMPPRIDCGGGGGPKTIREVQQSLNDRKIPGTYTVAGRVVVVGDPENNEASTHPLPVAAVPADPPKLASLLANHTYTYRIVRTKTESYEAEYTPAAAHLNAVLARGSWPGLRPLNGVIGAPVLRPDGTLLQESGYDEATGLYLASRLQVPRVPAQPSADVVAWARGLLLDWVLRDFPWCGDADRANYLAMLFTQVLRHYLRRSLVPFFPVTARAPGAGKSLLITIAGVLYGMASLTWTGDDAELRKTLTSFMRTQEGVMVFDNLLAGTVVRSAVLSKLLTDRTWGDRMLGGNVLGQFANDRLWCATGNNLRIGGDMASRVVLVSIDPARPHPERRSGFAIADLEGWIQQSENQRNLLAAVLVLVADWAAAGCPEAGVVPMRQFTPWARVCGGLLAHHGVDGFLANAGEVEEIDDDDSDWTGFLARWQAVMGTGWVTSEQLAQRAADPRWEGTFPTGRGDELLDVAKSVGRRLAAQRGRYHGPWVLRGSYGRHEKKWLWQVEYRHGE
jgi:hypothetical protein